ncbi:MAG: ornithine decarboxylase [Proteobacteria bacterium]|nr:MAG: ornithine decarboxylase [Pseudomonadota bacterium]
MSDIKQEILRKSLDFYHSASQLRFDTWHRLEHYTSQLSGRASRKAEIARFRKAAHDAMTMLETIEYYTAFPSREDFELLWKLFEREDYGTLARIVARLIRSLTSHSYRRQNASLVSRLADGEDLSADAEDEFVEEDAALAKPYFEVLFVEDMSAAEEKKLRAGLREMRRAEDPFIYEVIVVPTFEDALIAILFNYNIQACVIRYGFPFRSSNHVEILQRYLAGIDESDAEQQPDTDLGPLLGLKMSELRPELDLYLVTDVAVEEIAATTTEKFRRIFYRQEDYLELHLAILRGIDSRFETPFFTALKDYSRKPTGVFHAMPISRGKSLTKSKWIRDMMQFYGMNVFLAETSATSGGLDSLLQPHGPLKKAQKLAARAFGARRTFFSTNGTSTSNKIVVQALIKPGDIVLIDRDCHKSHHYGMVLAGARVSYLDSYPLNDFSMYGAVPLAEIKRRLLQYKRAGLLDRVKMLLLTNCTFDGIVYNVEQIMEECLAIKPDLIFLWDEAWFAFAGFHPTYRKRTAMYCARMLEERYRSQAYRDNYEKFGKQLKKLESRDDDEAWVSTRLMPDPDRVRIRVYATQSTHKTLTSLRQGSMIHIYDQEFRHKAEESFSEAFMTHTSTSPNYQILASLDVGRRQVELEGYELVQKQLDLAMALRERISSHPLLSKYFRVLVARDMVPEAYRASGIDSYFDPKTGWRNLNMEEAWAKDHFVVDPSRITLAIGNTGIDGDTFKNQYLMEKYGIQINKTSRNTVLFMTNIGTTRSSVAYLIGVLVKIANELDREWRDSSPREQRLIERRVNSLTAELPPLPDFSRFHQLFRTGDELGTPDGDIRTAYFLSYDERLCDYVRIDEDVIDKELAAGRDVVSAGFVIPYPPGFPILVPGQLVSEEILHFMRALDVKEIHGYRPDLGLRIFREEAIASVSEVPAPITIAEIAEIAEDMTPALEFEESTSSLVH